MFKKSLTVLALALVTSSFFAQAEDSKLAKQGEAIFQAPAGCWICHGKNAEGQHAPELTFAPEPIDISTALNSVTQMAPIAERLKLTNEDIYALSEYLARFEVEEEDE